MATRVIGHREVDALSVVKFIALLGGLQQLHKCTVSETSLRTHLMWLDIVHDHLVDKGVFLGNFVELLLGKAEPANDVCAKLRPLLLAPLLSNFLERRLLCLILSFRVVFLRSALGWRRPGGLRHEKSTALCAPVFAGER